MLSVKQGGIKYHFLVFGMTRPGIESRSPRQLTNNLTIMPIGGVKLDMDFSLHWMATYPDNISWLFLAYIETWIFTLMTATDLGEGKVWI